MKKLSVFGSTGSVGRNCLEFVRRNRREFKVTGLCAYKDIKTLRAQIEEFKPSCVCVVREDAARKLSREINKKIKLFKGQSGLEEFSQIDSQISMMAISGVDCLKPLLLNLRHSERIALANKESVVTGGKFIFEEMKRLGKEIIPVDSEINALFQLMHLGDKGNKAPESVRKIYLTASGGSLCEHKTTYLSRVGIKEVLTHPTWNMGKRITVDSATLVNKGFEVVEAHHFFNMDYSSIEVLIHKDSLVHALLEFKDSSVFASIYPPDMKTPIASALCYPRRFSVRRCLNFNRGISLSFSPVSSRRYPLFKIVIEAARRDDNSLIILNACDETAVEYFLSGKIKFLDIRKAIRHIFKKYPSHKVKCTDDIFYWDEWGRRKTKEYLERI
ncbi:MAG: 1-deoxy-D-xylulose-5-phosphate reductoisomerase [Candidatus Omnitrophica bacterium]|nr:1-deoxy-D-xylulose-5-phosphate reductoisomerase [Candidatus Omnitrophota bacterium]MBD3269870.1 1-deoxy-D-xylulose-5-phosphate reductoisomerase [Candidatus Omnitrophota bacterium]